MDTTNAKSVRATGRRLSDSESQTFAGLVENYAHHVWADGAEGIAKSPQTEQALATLMKSIRAGAVEHQDDAAVDAFATAMKAKLAAARARGRGGWQDKDDCPQQRLSDMLRAHVEKGDPRDVANFCMFLHQRGEAILPVNDHDGG